MGKKWRGVVRSLAGRNNCPAGKIILVGKIIKKGSGKPGRKRIFGK